MSRHHNMTPKATLGFRVTTSGIRVATLTKGIRREGVESRHDNLTSNYRVMTLIPESRHHNEAATLKTKLQTRDIKNQSSDIETHNSDIVRTSRIQSRDT